MNKRTTILIVDEPAIRRFLRTSLAAQNFAIIEADSGAAALTAVRATNPISLFSISVFPTWTAWR
jgi:two-component system KDP operon response regulator KdpE